MTNKRRDGLRKSQRATRRRKRREYNRLLRAYGIRTAETAKRFIRGAIFVWAKQKVIAQFVPKES